MKILRPIFIVIIVFSIIFTLFIGKGKISQNKITENVSVYKGILTLWQIDGFEGGSGSRRQFLMKTARAFERENEGVLIMVSNHTKESAEENIKEGIYPDMISYSVGVDVKNIVELPKSYKNCSVGGLVGDKAYGVAWCRGGYVLICNPLLVQESANMPTEVENMVVSQSDYTQPLTALILEGINVKEYESLPPLDAYIKFTAGKTPYFLATQRDIVRLNNRGMEYIAYPLTKYNDLYQYISVCSTKDDKIAMSNAFIELLISKDWQERLNDISMMSVLFSSSLENQSLKDMQKVNGFSTISAFTSPQLIKNNQILCQQFLQGDEKALPKIKNIIYKP